MTAGRPPIPLEKKALAAKGDGMQPGGHRASKAVEVRNRSVAVAPEPPEGLGERGLAEWQKVWTAGRVWLHPTEDYHWVEQIAFAYDEIALFREEIERTGLIVTGYNKQMTANPLLREIRDAQSVIRKCLSILGFSPTDRAKLGLAELKVQTGIADLQNKTKEARGGR